MTAPTTSPLERHAPSAEPDVWVVEDHPQLGEVLAELLELAGYTVRWLRSGAEAFDRLRTERAPKLVVIEGILPEMNGPQLRSACRRIRRLRGLPFVILSTDHPEAASAGVARLIKPFDARQLLAAVRRFVAPDARARRPAEASAA